MKNSFKYLPDPAPGCETCKELVYRAQAMKNMVDMLRVKVIDLEEEIERLKEKDE